MKNQREIYEALLAGETLDNGGFTVQLGFNGTLLDDEDDKINLTFSDPSRWKIYKKPKWYENIPDGGVLCWADEIHDMPATIVRFSDADKMFVSGWGARYSRSTPLTKQEIQKFMDNAPSEDL